MSLKSITSTVMVAVLTAGSLLPLASAANARDYGRHHGGGYGGYGPRVVERHVSPRHFRSGQGNRWDGHRRHRDHTGRNIAIGAFATILGLALAAEANRTQHRYYDDRD
ncbi:MAG: hypothetical protein ABL897_09160 [Hyphomicrobium sp.]